MQFLESESPEYVSLMDPKRSNSSRFSRKKCGICAAFVASLLVIGAVTSSQVGRGSSFALITVKKDEMRQKNFYKIDNTAASATEAAALCASTGGQLARIDSENDVKRAMAECKHVQGCYISLVRNPLSGIFIWGDGSPLVKDYFIKGGNSQPTAQKPCLEMVGEGKNHGKWNGIPCQGLTRNILCMNKGKLFYRVPGLVTSAAEYGVLCRSSGGEMAVILNSEENRRAWTACGGRDGCWLGAGRDPVSYQFMWLDGTGVCFENWAANEPTGQPNEGCAMIDTNGDWSDLPCVGKSLGVLCQSW